MDAKINKKIDIGSIKQAKYDFYRRHLLVKKILYSLFADINVTKR